MSHLSYLFYSLLSFVTPCFLITTVLPDPTWNFLWNSRTCMISDIQGIPLGDGIIRDTVKIPEMNIEGKARVLFYCSACLIWKSWENILKNIWVHIDYSNPRCKCYYIFTIFYYIFILLYFFSDSIFHLSPKLPIK